MAPRPMVAMITAMIGLPSSGRNTMRSSAKLNSTMTAMAVATPASAGMPWALSVTAATKPASMTNSPWAKLIASVAL